MCPIYMMYGCLPAQHLLMLIMKGIFQDFEEWMIVIFDKILVSAHDYEDGYNKSNPAQDKAHEREAVVKISQSCFGRTNLIFSGY